jgi:hypothetical protein
MRLAQANREVSWVRGLSLESLSPGSACTIPMEKSGRLLDIHKQVAAGPKRAVEDGFPNLAGWLEFQGGLAQYHNAHPSLRQMDAGR